MLSHVLHSLQHFPRSELVFRCWRLFSYFSPLVTTVTHFTALGTVITNFPALGTVFTHFPALVTVVTHFPALRIAVAHFPALFTGYTLFGFCKRVKLSRARHRSVVFIPCRCSFIIAHFGFFLCKLKLLNN